MDTSHGHISTDGDSLSFSPLAISDTGNYTCELTVTTQLIYMYVSVQEPVQSAVEDITVEGNGYTQITSHSNRVEPLTTDVRTPR